VSPTSAGWPRGRAVDGGVDEIPLPVAASGRLWLCGKHAIAPDPERLLATTGATSVVCLTERSELADRYPGYVSWLDAQGAERVIWFPIHDLGAPPLEEYLMLLDRVTSELGAGSGVLAHCAAGLGRAGTLAVAVLMHAGLQRSEALANVAACRPMAGPEAGAQAELLVALERVLQARS
jgi:protein-tyrosine phosphatase